MKITLTIVHEIEIDSATDFNEANKLGLEWASKLQVRPDSLDSRVTWCDSFVSTIAVKQEDLTEAAHSSQGLVW